MLWEIVWWHRQASLHTFMLPFSPYEMSLCIQCPLPWLRSLRSTALQFFTLCSVTIFCSHFTPRICFHLPVLMSLLHSHNILTLSFFVSPTYPSPSLFALLNSTPNDIWRKWQLRSVIRACFTDLVFSKHVKAGRSWMSTDCTFELMSSGDTLWSWSTNTEVVTDCGLSVSYITSNSVWSQKRESSCESDNGPISPSKIQSCHCVPAVILLFTVYGTALKFHSNPSLLQH